MLIIRQIANREFDWVKPLAIVATVLVANACGDARHHTLPTDPPTTAAVPLSDRSLACDGQFVTRTGTTISVVPTGTDDTHNLQCALDAAPRAGVVQLSAGVYHTAQIVASNFQGTLRGRGTTKTFIVNLPDLVVTVQDFYTERPDAAHTWPALFAFWQSDLTLSDLTIRVLGDAPTTGWSFAGTQLKELALAVAMLGRTGYVRASDVEIDAQPTPNTLLGSNLLNGIYLQGHFGGNLGPLSGSITVTRSTFRHVADPMPVTVVDGFHGEFTDNVIEDAFQLSIADVAHATMRYAHNSVNSVLGFNTYDFPDGISNSTLLFEGNTMSGTWASHQDATFGPHVTCLYVGNKDATQNGLYLGEGSSKCKAVGLEGSGR